MNGMETAQQYELHFQPLRETTRGYTFPCDAHGRVDMDRLAHPKLNDYLFARAFIGREFSMPAVRPALEPA